MGAGFVGFALMSLEFALISRIEPAAEPFGEDSLQLFHNLMGMVALGFGIGVVPKAVIDHSPMGDKVRVLTATPALKSIEVGVCLLKKRLDDPLIQAFQQTALEPI